MSDYNRITRECLVSQLYPELRQAIKNYFQEHQLGDLEAETCLCCETISQKKNAGERAAWLKDTSSDTTIHTGMLLTSEWLIWARSGDKSGLRLNAANLKHISVRPYSSIFTKDTGLEVFGLIEDSNVRMRGYIGMGSEAAAQKFCDEVIQAIIKANPPAPKNLSKWPWK